MLFRTFAVLVILATAAPARAEVHLDAGLGFGAAAYSPCAYPGNHCEDPSHRAYGFAPHFGVGVRDRRPLDERLQLRYGAFAAAMLVPAQPVGPDATANVLTGAGELGLEVGIFSIDMSFGLSRIHLTDGMTSATGAGFEIGFALGLQVARDVTLVSFADAHAVMHGDSAALFIGGGLQWTPRL